MVIKKHHNKNHYYLTESGLWVRDFTKSAKAEDINKLVVPSDYELLLENELANAVLNVASIDSETIYAPNVVIVSDGYDFENKQQLLKKLSQQKVVVIGVNRSLVKWKMPRRMDWYVINNPYQECMAMLPQHTYYPRCIASTRTNPKFIQRYRARLGVMYKYCPTPDRNFSSSYGIPSLYHIDDYRNPICAAISIVHHWEVQNLLLLCCDDSFKDERPGSEKLKNGLWQYPQQNVSHGLIDGSLYWLANQQNIKVKIANHSSGIEYKNASYINEDDISNFFD
jgi:hypothetical protein